MKTMSRQVSVLLTLVAIGSSVSCKSSPYVVHTTIDRDRGVKTDRVCTHKTAYIPWYAVYVAGVFTHKYGEECEEQTTTLEQ